VRLNYFIDLRAHLDILASVVGPVGGHLTIHHFATEGGITEFHVVPAGADGLAEIYQAGGYRAILISLEDAPTHSQDWDFYRRAADQLLVMEGGRQTAKAAELSHLRIFGVSAQTKTLFGKVKRRTLKRCTHRGLQSRTGEILKNCYYDPGLAGLELRQWMGDASDQFCLVEPGMEST
jgi:hypothetical protein